MRVDPIRAVLTVEQCWQPVPGGSASYIAELTRALSGLDDVRIVGLAARHRADEMPDPRPHTAVVHSSLPRTALYEAWNRLRRPRADGIDGSVDVVHATTWAIPGHRVPLVATVHDLAFLRDPSNFTRRGNSYFRRALAVARDEAAVVVVPSRATADDCVAAGIERDRITVIPHGVRADAVAPEVVAAWRARRGLPEGYVLWCGTVEPRKNVAGLVEAFTLARGEGATTSDLVLVGPAGWGDEARRLERALAAAPAGSVHVLGRLSAAELQVAYAGAGVFAYPSLWEGFGMPVLEAMAHGVPVVTSRGTAMAEFVEGAGELVQPGDVPALAAAIGRAPQIDREHVRATAARFTWEASAAAHVEVYRHARGEGVMCG